MLWLASLGRTSPIPLVSHSRFRSPLSLTGQVRKMFAQPFFSRRVAFLANLLEVLIRPTHAAAPNRVVAVWKGGFLGRQVLVQAIITHSKSIFDAHKDRFDLRSVNATSHLSFSNRGGRLERWYAETERSPVWRIRDGDRLRNGRAMAQKPKRETKPTSRLLARILQGPGFGSTGGT